MALCCYFSDSNDYLWTFIFTSCLCRDLTRCLSLCVFPAGSFAEPNRVCDLHSYCLQRCVWLLVYWSLQHLGQNYQGAEVRSLRDGWKCCFALTIAGGPYSLISNQYSKYWELEPSFVTKNDLRATRECSVQTGWIVSVLPGWPGSCGVSGVGEREEVTACQGSEEQTFQQCL